MASTCTSSNQTMATKLSLKLLIDRNTKKVLFGEANKDFTDFLFTILACPIGYVTKLLTEEGMVGCMGSLYKSLENLSLDYVQPNLDKDIFLQPKVPIPTTGSDPPLLLQKTSSTPSKFYTCKNSFSYNHPCNITDVKGTVCPSCSNGMITNAVYIESTAADSGSSGGGGCVKGVVNYMVTDDLSVTPMSGISSISLLSKFKVKDVDALEEKVVEVGMDEGLAILKASLESKTVLTDVFGGKPKRLNYL